MAKGTNVNGRKVAAGVESDSDGWVSVKIRGYKHNRINKLCQRTGQPVAFYIDEALEHYFSDEFPLWEEKFEDFPIRRKR